MKTRALLLGAPLLLILPCCASLSAPAVPSSFLGGVKLEAGGEVIDAASGHLVPCALDWNDDGLKDLVVGQFSGGKINLFLNRGSHDEARLEESSFLEAGGAQISLPAG